ncbi:hypothetical protein ACIOMQ_38680 [Streptomyces sp. NPDC087845]|uniref:hypothetical protein n=1 Tax=Streptomyces sp. NPDC087845 TaxID=3365806 RepID=UPI0038079898
MHTVAAVVHLSPTATLLTALADDALTLRRHLDQVLTDLPSDCAMHQAGHQAGLHGPTERHMLESRAASGD